uniref:Lysophosphatidylcholine acyltransferase 4 n=1 Tax=Xiphophorus couchianus TaxID=32473 RepID=A0A3B5LGV1_9TELE
MEKGDCCTATQEYPHPFIFEVKLTRAQRIRVTVYFYSVTRGKRPLLEFNQSVLVSRKDPESRKEAVVKLNERLTSKGYWPQMLMFPEGTTTNGRYLPVYNPSEEEKKDPSLYADNVQRLMAKALGVPATDHVMEGRVPVSKLGGLSLPLESPGRVTLSLLRKNGLEAREIKAALAKMIDRCRSGALGSKASADELTSIFSLKDKQTAVSICGLYSKDETVDLRQLYFSVSALSDFTNFKALLHSAFTLFDQESKGSLSAEELSDLMGALLGIPQHNTMSKCLTESLLRVLTTHPTYQKVVNDYLQGEEAGPQPLPAAAAANGKAVNNNGVTHGANGFLQHNKKFE